MSVEQKRAFNKLKHDLEPWRHIIVSIDTVLQWETNYHPAEIAGTVSAFYLLLWLMDLSTITMLALVGLVAMTFDLVYPYVARLCFCTSKWSGNQEEQFERVCNELCSLKLTLASWYETLFTSRECRSPVFVAIVCASLVSLAWIGAVINNLLLMYIVTLVLALFPGIQNKCLLNKVKQQFDTVVNSKLQSFKTNKDD